jgi:hypothetical protein
MKRVILYFSIFIISIVGWHGESRRFFCVDNDKCITVWKTYNNVCYIIPGKYYGLLKPSGNVMESSNNNNLTIYFTSQLPNAFVYKSEQELKISNNKKDEFIFYDYNSDFKKFDTILYIFNAKKNNDLKQNAQLLDIFIRDNFALDRDGKRL